MGTIFKHIFEPISIGRMELKNRLVMPAMGTRYAAFGGWVSDRLIDYLVERARGGVGLITLEMTAVTFTGRISNYSPGLYDDKLIAGYARLTHAVKKAGARVAVQLAHGGAGSSSAVTGVQPVAPSPVGRLKGESPRELSTGEIETLVEAFAAAAERARKAGFDAVELHMAHGYLIDQFLSPISNRRTDPYGGSLDGRARIALDVLKRTKERVGRDLAVICRITGDQFMPGGFTLQESKRVSKMLQDAGADAIHVTGGSIETTYMSAPPMAVPEGCLVFLAEETKKVLDVPVITVGKIRTPALAEEIIASGKADLVAIGRGLIADPEFARKAYENRADEIRPCISCNNPQCHGRTSRNLDLGCTVNPAVGRETNLKVHQTQDPKKVLVIGAGPAGLEAARILALRGHRPVLCEKTSQLGGQLRLGCVPPYKEEVKRLIDYFSSQMKKLKVDLIMEGEVTSRLLSELRPDVVIIATGGRASVPSIKNVEKFASNAMDVLAGKTRIGKKVVVIGGGDVGCETAEYLARKGCEVTILEMMAEPGTEYIWWAKKLLYDRLADLNVNLLTSSKVIEIEKGSVSYEREGVKNRIDSVDTIVFSTGLEAEREIASLIEKSNIEFFVIGDARNPKNISSAIREGFEVASKI